MFGREIREFREFELTKLNNLYKNFNYILIFLNIYSAPTYKSHANLESLNEGAYDALIILNCKPLLFQIGMGLM